jgi:hypothetical protein
MGNCTKPILSIGYLMILRLQGMHNLDKIMKGYQDLLICRNHW